MSATDPDPPQLQLALLGQPEVRRAGRLVEFRTRRALALLLYLAAEPGRHSREKLTALFWPDSDAEHGRASLRRTLAYLREAVGPGDHLLIEREALEFDFAAEHALDLAVVQAAWKAARAGGSGAPLPVLHAGVAACRGDFLAGFSLEGSPEFDEWASLQREAWHRRMDLVFERLAERQAAAADWPAALETVARWLAHHPLNEAAHRRLMQLHFNSGDRAGALSAYAACRAVLAQELNAEPSTETQALFARIQADAANAPAGPAAAPRPPAAPRSAGLPGYLSAFVGRQSELDEINRLLADPACRLLTLVGPGGAGKTRLAVEAASRASAASAREVAFVPLATLNQADQIVPAVAAAVGLTFYGPAEPHEQLRHYWRDRTTLIILDNVEHLLAGPGQAALVGLVADWLGAAPGLTALATAREPLGVPGEWVLEVTGLGQAAAELFVQSARQVRVGFTPAPADEPAIARICHLVEGLPLGLELAAAWVRTLSCSEIAAEIERGLDFLAQARGPRPERHRSLRAVFDHSWALLTEAERQVLRRLAVFSGGFTREAAEQVAEANLAMLSDLVAKSLMRRLAGGPGGRGAPRYDLHELVRRYALDQLERAGEAAELRDRHLDYFLRRVDPAAAPLYSAEQADRLADWDHDLDNLRAALGWAFASPDSPGAERAGEGADPRSQPAAAERRSRGLRLAARLDRFWQGRGHVREGCGWLECGLAQPEGVPVLVRAEAYNTLGWLANQIGNVEQAQAWQAASLALYRQAEDRTGIAAALDGLGDIAWTQDDFENAQAHYQGSLALRRELGDELATGLSLYSLGRLYVDHGQLELARAHLREALARLEACQDQRGIALALNGLGRLALREGAHRLAGEHLRAALRRFHALGNRVDIAECLEELAVVARDAGQGARAARIWGAAEALREAIGVPAPTGYYDVIAGVLHDRLGEAAFTTAWAEGRAWALEQAVAAALEPAD